MTQRIQGYTEVVGGRGRLNESIWRGRSGRAEHQRLGSTYPEIVGELQGKDGNALVVKGASNRAGNIARNDGDEAGRQQPRALVP